jgi:integral membrane protein (TIGR01906 family)
MKKLHWVSGIILSLAIIVILLFSSFQAAMYIDFGFYEKEYEKYNVLPELGMKMDDVMYVTREMMDYLKGDRENLEVITTVDGEKQDFFNEQDKLHMADVQRLFLGGLKIRAAGIIVLLICLAFLIGTKANWKYILPRAFQIALALAGAVTATLAFIFMRDFSAAFTKFHQIFFTNDLWMFDPAEDYMIRMLPEGLFSDFVIRIGGIFAGGLILLLIVSVIWGKKTKINKTY